MTPQTQNNATPTFDQILDDYAKRGLLDGNAVARLSAAHKRETPPAPGNAAAMREALTRCATLAEYCAQDIRAEVSQVARAALSAPARNCDRFATREAAFEAWLETSQSLRFTVWLFAPAEGGKE